MQLTLTVVGIYLRFYCFLTGLKNPLTLMSYVTPVMALFTALLSLVMDPWDKVRTSRYFDSSGHIISSFFLMLFGGTLAFFMVTFSTFCYIIILWFVIQNKVYLSTTFFLSKNLFSPLSASSSPCL